MESIAISTNDDFNNYSSSSLKRKTHSSIACGCCRKLKIRCQGGAPDSSAAASTPKSCDNCSRLRKICTWPEEDGRKRPRFTITNTRPNQSVASSHERETPIEDRHYSPTSPSDADEARLDDHQYPGPPKTTDNSTTRHSTADFRDANRVNGKESVHGSAAADGHSQISQGNPVEEESYATLHYYRHLGPTAIAPGHKKVLLKIRNDVVASTRRIVASGNGLSESAEQFKGLARDDVLPLFDSVTDLPSPELLPQLLESFFEFYGDNFCFLNRQYLDLLIKRGEASSFLICAISALSSRVCPTETFTRYFATKTNGKSRERWEYSLPFLEKAKKLLMPLLNIPSSDVVAGMLLLSWVDFGDNNEAGLWMFTGMSLRMAQELGLHREHLSMGPGVGQSPVGVVADGEDRMAKLSESPPDCVGIDEFERSARILLFWCIFTQDTCLSSGTGRVPSIKRDEISIRLPDDKDLAIITAGPGCVPHAAKPSAYVQMVRMMLAFARSLEFLNTDFGQTRNLPSAEKILRTDRLERLKRDITEDYGKLPRETQFGAAFYQEAVKSGQAGPYLLLHLFFHLQIAFITHTKLEAIGEYPEMTGEAIVSNREPQNLPNSKECANLPDKKIEEELYRTAIRSIVDMLTFAKLIDDRALLTTFYLNQAFFHAACAYIHDMLQLSGTRPLLENNEPSTFPIPNDASISRGSSLDNHEQVSSTCRKSKNETESTYSYLALIAKTNYHFLRKAVKDMTKIYAGAGWVDAVLDQRETGLKDVDLSIVSEKISTYIRLHDLRGRGGSNKALHTTQAAAGDEVGSCDNQTDDNAFWKELPSGLFADTELDFDPQAFFDDYMCTELANYNVYSS